MTCSDLDREVEELQGWRKKGPLGKLHNVLTWISRTLRCRDRFEEKVWQNNRGLAVKALSLIPRNAIR